MIHEYPYKIYKPGLNHIPRDLQPYIQLVDSQEGFTAMMEGAVAFFDFINHIPSDRMGYRYEEGKWTVEQVLLHLVDVERMYQNRALRIARKEPRALSGFDQDRYVRNLPDISRSIESIRDEYETVRKSTFLLYAGLTKVEMKLQGRVGQEMISLPSIPFIIAGHEIHHLKILRERYGILP